MIPTAMGSFFYLNFPKDISFSEVFLKSKSQRRGYKLLAVPVIYPRTRINMFHHDGIYCDVIINADLYKAGTLSVLLLHFRYLSFYLLVTLYI